MRVPVFLVVSATMLLIILGSSNGSLNTGPAEDQSGQMSCSDPLVCIQQGKDLTYLGRYNDSIYFFDQSIRLLDIKSYQLKQNSQEIQNRINDSMREYERLAQYYLEAERQYNPEAMMDRGLIETGAAAIMSFIPNPKIGPGKGVEIPVKEAKSIVDIPGKAGIFKDTLEALKWKSGGRDKYQGEINETGTKIIKAQQEYEQVMGEYRSVLQSLAEAWSLEGNAFSNLGRYQDAVEAYNHAIELDPASIDARDARSKILAAMN